MTTKTAIKIDIWSDIVCPFCYIGKRNLELALKNFPARDQVKLHWKSFELDPHGKKTPEGNAYETLARKYGRSVEWAKQATARTAAMAKDVGLDFDYDRIIPANTFNAHRLVHLADREGLQERAEERLMKAYFTDGENINDTDTLVRLAVDIGLDTTETKILLATDAFTTEVRRDEEEAMRLGIHGVPFFLINGEVPLEGAHPPEAFLSALESLLPEH